MIAVNAGRGTIWYARVLEVQEEKIRVQYFDSIDTSRKWYKLLLDTGEEIDRGSIICNGVQVQPTLMRSLQIGKSNWK